MNGQPLAALARQRGFSLLELLVVVSLMAVIAGFGTLRLIDYAERRSVDAVVTDVLTIGYAVQAYAANHAGLWPDGAGDPPCGNALQALLDAEYTGGTFESPWATVDSGYITACPLSADDRQDSFVIRFRVPVDYAGVVRSRLPSTAIADHQPDDLWTWATHYLPLPRYHAGRVAVHEVAAPDAAVAGDAQTPAAACPAGRRQVSVQPLNVCLPSDVALGAPLQTCQTYHWTVEVPHGFSTIERQVSKHVCYDLPRSVRGYYTEIGQLDMNSAQQTLKLMVTADGINFHQVAECNGVPVRFSVMEFCQ
jgi:prepilin-type N-terminal cleavage/methylation domain-containing protein